jgi:hypothetical protein
MSTTTHLPYLFPLLHSGEKFGRRKPRWRRWQAVIETEFQLTAVINVTSHWGEIREKQRGKEEKTSIIFLLKTPLSSGTLAAEV